MHMNVSNIHTIPSEVDYKLFFYGRKVRIIQVKRNTKGVFSVHLNVGKKKQDLGYNTFLKISHTFLLGGWLPEKNCY